MWPADGDGARLYTSRYAQPATAVLSLAAARWWEGRGVRAHIALGHSLGELGAAAWAGACTPEAAVRLAVARGRLLDALPERGVMVTLLAPAREVDAALVRGAEIAAVNGPANTVVAGVAAAVEATVEAVGADVVRLHIDQSSHNALVEPILDAWEAAASEVAWRRPVRAYVSNLRGEVQRDAPTPADWRAHMRRTVRFADGLRVLERERVACFVEVGPHPTLLRLARGALRHGSFAATFRRDAPAVTTPLRAAAALFEAGC